MHDLQNAKHFKSINGYQIYCAGAAKPSLRGADIAATSPLWEPFSTA